MKNILLSILLLHASMEGTDLTTSIEKIRDAYKILPKLYDLHPEDPIDVVIPCTFKDRHILPYCIAGIRQNCSQIRHIILLSESPLSNDIEWFDEALFPFTKKDIAYEILQDEAAAEAWVQHPQSRVNWIYQQLLKLYAPFVIPNISTNVLILDADIIFIQPVHFMDDAGNPLFGFATQYHPPYFAHMRRVLPWLHRVEESYSAIIHHALFQKEILEDFFHQVEDLHQIPFWKALLRCIDLQDLDGSPLSEYEMYFNFALLSTDQVQIRPIAWTDEVQLRPLTDYIKNDYVFISYQSYRRESDHVPSHFTKSEEQQKEQL